MNHPDTTPKERLEKEKLRLEIARLYGLSSIETEKAKTDLKIASDSFRRQITIAVVGLLIPALSLVWSVHSYTESQRARSSEADSRAKAEREASLEKSKSELAIRERQMLIQALGLLSKPDAAERIAGAVALSAAVTPGSPEAKIATGALLARLAHETDIPVIEAVSRSVANFGVSAAPEIVSLNQRSAYSVATSVADWSAVSDRRLTERERKAIHKSEESERAWLWSHVGAVLERSGLPMQPDLEGINKSSSIAELNILGSKKFWAVYTDRRESLLKRQGAGSAPEPEGELAPNHRRHIALIESQISRHARTLAGTSLALVQILRTSSPEAIQKLDLSGISLTRGNLDGTNLMRARLKSALVYASLRNANLSGAVLSNAHIEGPMGRADFRTANLEGAQIRGIGLLQVLFFGRSCKASADRRSRFPIMDENGRKLLLDHITGGISADGFKLLGNQEKQTVTADSFKQNVARLLVDCLAPEVIP
ncbi:MAG: pentapeptide repeat-containing protein [Burkholderiales bacterium]|nr:pentapeptide repeat-containing protein [Burkholderiales bacterium]